MKKVVHYNRSPPDASSNHHPKLAPELSIDADTRSGVVNPVLGKFPAINLLRSTKVAGSDAPIPHRLPTSFRRITGKTEMTNKHSIKYQIMLSASLLQQLNPRNVH
eukprot:IDg21680t1